MGRNLDKRLATLEQRSPARGHLCEIVKVRADGRQEVINTLWTHLPIDRILVKYGSKKSAH